MATTDTSFKVKNNLIVLGTLTSSFSANVSVTGTVTATNFSGDGASLTNLNAANINSGTVAAERLGSGTASTTTFLRGDNTWRTIDSGGGGGGGIAWTVSAAATTLTAGSAQIVTAAVNKTLPATVSAGDEFIVHAKVTGVRIVSNGNVITGVGSGNNLTLAAGETARLIASATGVLEIV